MSAPNTSIIDLVFLVVAVLPLPVFYFALHSLADDEFKRVAKSIFYLFSCSAVVIVIHVFNNFFEPTSKSYVLLQSIESAFWFITSIAFISSVLKIYSFSLKYGYSRDSQETGIRIDELFGGKIK